MMSIPKVVAEVATRLVVIVLENVSTENLHRHLRSRLHKDWALPGTHVRSGLIGSGRVSFYSFGSWVCVSTCPGQMDPT